MSCLCKVLIILLPLIVVPSMVSADIVSSGGLLTYEQTGNDGFIRRYSFDGQMTDELEVNLAGLPAEVDGIVALTVVNSRVIVAESPTLGGRSIGEISKTTGNVSYLFDHQGFIGNISPRLDTTGSELLIHSIQNSTSGTTQAYTLQGDFLRPYFIPTEEYSMYLGADGIAYSNGELFYSAATTNPPQSNLIGVFDASITPVMPVLREIPMASTAIGEISVNSGNDDIWSLSSGGAIVHYDASGNQLGTFSTVSPARDIYVLSTTAVPEPSSLTLLAIAAAYFGIRRRRPC